MAYTISVGTLEKAIPIVRYLFIEGKRWIDKCRVSLWDAALFRIIEVGIKYPTRNRIRLDEYKILRLRRKHTGDVQLILVSHREYQKLGYNILSFFSFVGQPKLRSS